MSWYAQACSTTNTLALSIKISSNSSFDNSFHVLLFQCVFSKLYLGILFTLVKCLPPSNSVFINVSTISIAVFKETNRDGMLNMFALLCVLANSAISLFQHRADLIF